MHDELDILREVGSIAAAQASNALAEFLGRPISLNMPSIDLVSFDAVPAKAKVEKVAVAVASRIYVGLPGQIAMIMDEKDAFKLLNLSCKIEEDVKNAGLFTEIGLSFMKEIGNITISAYVLAMGLVLKKQILTSIPTLLSGTVDSILNTLFSSTNDDYVYVVEAVFEDQTEKLRGGYCLALTAQSAVEIREICKKILSELEH